MAPAFWTRPPGPVLRSLAPLAPGRRRPRTRQAEAPIPVVAVGSLSLGSTGKTPAVIALAQRLAMRGRGVHVVTTGPGAALRVDERTHTAREVGDEPLLVSAFALTWIAADPVEGIHAAAASGAELVILDSGTERPPVQTHAEIAVEDATRGFGNGLAWPLGPLAERLDTGLKDTDLLLAVGPAAARAGFRRAWAAELPCPIVGADLAPLPTGMDWQGLEVIAFAGIGAPERFFATLRALGANVIRAQALSDHQDMTPALLNRLATEARRARAQLVTTEKDAVRLPQSFRPQIVSLPVRLEPEDWQALDALFP